MTPNRYDIFISYRNSNGFMTARIFRDRLVERGYRVFFDVETLRNGPFDQRLLGVIENCRDFVLILSPNSLDRCVNEGDWVRTEISHAIKHKRNIVPVYERDFSFPDPKLLPDELEGLFRYQGVRADHEYFDAAFEKFLGFLTCKPKSRLNVAKKSALAVFAGVVLSLVGYQVHRTQSLASRLDGMDSNAQANEFKETQAPASQPVVEAALNQPPAPHSTQEQAAPQPIVSTQPALIAEDRAQQASAPEDTEGAGGMYGGFFMRKIRVKETIKGLNEQLLNVSQLLEKSKGDPQAERYYTQLQKQIETQLSAKNKEMESIEKGEEQAISNTTPVFGGR